MWHWSKWTWKILLVLLLLSHFSRVQLCATPQMAAYQSPPSLGFSRQEQWNGLPFPSPKHACILSHFSRVYESAIGIHISPPFCNSLPSPSPSHPSRLLQSSCLSFLSHTANSHWPLAIHFTHGNVSFHVTLSVRLTLSSPLPMSISLFSMSVSPMLPYK